MGLTFSHVIIILLIEKLYYLRSEGDGMENLMENLKERLKSLGLKLTPQRRATLEVLYNKKGQHLTTEEIYDLVKVDCPEIGLATVYRTLQLLEEMGLISKLDLDDGCSRYEYNVHEDDHQHHHLICQSCGKVIEVEIDLLDQLEEEIERVYHFAIKDHKVKFFGICAECN